MPFKTYREPHSADPLAMWCGEGGRKTRLYPITPGMGMILWGASPLYVNPGTVEMTEP